MSMPRWLALLTLYFGFAVGAAAADSTRHSLWSLKGAANTVYLLGSVHFLSAAEQLPQAMDAAYSDAEVLIMEIDMDDLDTSQTQQLMLELGMLPAQQTLEQMLGPKAYGALTTRARDLGVDPALLNRFQPWLAAMTLVQLQLLKLGLEPTSGIEHRLTARAAADRKPIHGLETLREQLGMMAGLPEKQQREFLLYTIEDADRMAKELDELLAAWRSGDSESLARLLAEGYEEFPDLYRPLTTDRNRRWLSRIEALLKERDDYLVVVGTLHLVGKDSVIDLLEAKGHDVRQH